MKSNFTLTVPEAARRLGIGRNVAYNAAKLGQIPTLKIGKRIVVPIAALENYLKNQKHPSLADVGKTKPNSDEALLARREMIFILEGLKNDLRLLLSSLDKRLARARLAVLRDGKASEIEAPGPK